MLYSAYDLVYVGQTGAQQDRLFNRLRAHRSDHLSERWDRFSWFGTQWVTQQHDLSADTAAVHETVEGALNMLEAVAVAIAEPWLNLQRGRWGNAKQYFQWWENHQDAGEQPGALANQPMRQTALSFATEGHCIVPLARFAKRPPSVSWRVVTPQLMGRSVKRLPGGLCAESAS